MNTKTTSFLLILITTLGARLTIASPLDARDDVGYVKQLSYGSGWVNMSPATDGIYVYGAAPKNTSRSNKAFMIGKPFPQDVVFLTAQEQEGIWRYKQAKIEALRLAALPPVIKISHKISYSNLNWPHVIVEGKKVCVPTLAFSESSDWQDHLLCTIVESLNVN